MGIWQSLTFWGAAAAYLVATVALFGAAVWRRKVLLAVASWAAAAGFAVHTVAVGVRWAAAGHFPYIQQYENVLVGTWVMVLAWLLVAWRWRDLTLSGALIMPAVLLTLGYSLTLPTGTSPVTPVYQSPWLAIHVTFAWITYATYTAVAGLAAVVLLRLRAERRGREIRGVPAWVPASDRIDEISMPLVAFGFLNNSVMIASGAIWAYRLWGSYWSWDPVETWSLLTWLAYGLYMHVHLTMRWRGARLAWIALFALFGVLMTFWGVQLVPTSYHLFRNIGGAMLTRP